MATHSSVLALRIPGTGEPGGLPSMGSHRVGHDWSDLAAAAAFFAILHSDAYIFPFLLCFSLLFFSQLFYLTNIISIVLLVFAGCEDALRLSLLVIVLNMYGTSLVSQWERICPQSRSRRSHQFLIPGSGRSPGRGHGNPFQYSCLENPMERGAWRATVHRVAELDTTEAM